MPKVADKTRFVDVLAAKTGAPIPFVTARIRSMYDAGVGPRRGEPLLDTVMAHYLLGFIAAPTHLEAPGIAKAVGDFFLKRVTAQGEIGRQSLETLARALPEVRPDTDHLQQVLAAIICGLREEAGFHVVNITAAWPPFAEVALRITPGGGGPPVELTYGPRGDIAADWVNPEPVWPSKFVHIFDGRVLEFLAPLGTRDDQLANDKGSDDAA
jgi:hypothetical protein